MTVELPEITISFYAAIIFIVLCICFIIYQIKHKNDEIDLQYDGYNKDFIIETCKKYICDNLKCPSTAQFPKIEVLFQDKYGRVFIDVSVDSQNGFGAMRRTDIGVVMYPQNNEYKITNCGICKYNFYKTKETIKKINNWNKPL